MNREETEMLTGAIGRLVACGLRPHFKMFVRARASRHWRGCRVLASWRVTRHNPTRLTAVVYDREALR